jgi:hypothetical protein
MNKYTYKFQQCVEMRAQQNRIWDVVTFRAILHEDNNRHSSYTAVSIIIRKSYDIKLLIITSLKHKAIKYILHYTVIFIKLLLCVPKKNSHQKIDSICTEIKKKKKKKNCDVNINRCNKCYSPFLFAIK